MSSAIEQAAEASRTSLNVEMDRLVATALKVKRERDLLLTLAQVVLAHFEDHEDIKDGPDGLPMPNDAMHMAETCRNVLAKVPA